MSSDFLELLAASPRVPCAKETGKFFGDSQDDEEPFDDEHTAEAVAICKTCPIRIPCLSDAIGNDEQWGVRGGMTVSQRQQLKGRI